MLLWTGLVHPALLAVGRDPGVLVSVSPGHGPPSFCQGQRDGDRKWDLTTVVDQIAGALGWRCLCPSSSQN